MPLKEGLERALVHFQRTASEDSQGSEKAGGVRGRSLTAHPSYSPAHITSPSRLASSALPCSSNTCFALCKQLREAPAFSRGVAHKWNEGISLNILCIQLPPHTKGRGGTIFRAN